MDGRAEYLAKQDQQRQLLAAKSRKQDEEYRREQKRQQRNRPNEYEEMAERLFVNKKIDGKSTGRHADGRSRGTDIGSVRPSSMGMSNVPVAPQIGRAHV